MTRCCCCDASDTVSDPSPYREGLQITGKTGAMIYDEETNNWYCQNCFKAVFYNDEELLDEEFDDETADYPMD